MPKTEFNQAPSEADWYYIAIFTVDDETTYADGYASGSKPTRAAFRKHAGHTGKIIEWRVARIDRR